MYPVHIPPQVKVSVRVPKITDAEGLKVLEELQVRMEQSAHSKSPFNFFGGNSTTN